MKNRIATVMLVALTVGASVLLGGCRAAPDDKTVVVTYSVLGAIVKELVGDEATVTVLIPDGADPHDWEPSARDIERVNNAALVVRNGLDLEESLESTLEAAEGRGARLFTATDHIEIRRVGEGEIAGHDHVHEGETGHEHELEVGAPDPHFWVDPLAMKSVVTALAAELESVLKIDFSARAQDLVSKLDILNSELAARAVTVPSNNRKLVTGHDSLGYFAQRYGFQLVGAVIPNLSTQAEISAADMAELIEVVREQQVKVIFTETGTSAAAVQQVASATGARVVELSPVGLPADGSYFTFMRQLTGDVVAALK